MLKTKIYEKIKMCSSGIATVFAVGFIVIIYAPLETLFSNREEFWYDFGLLFPYLLFTWIVLVIIGISALVLVRNLSKKIYELTVITAFFMLIDFYIQGNFLVKSLPPLDGRLIDWSLYPLERLKSVILICFLVLCAIACCKFFGMAKMVKYAGYISLAITSFLLITIVMLGISTKGYRSKSQYTCTAHNMSTFSSDENFIIFVLDSVSGYKMKELFDSEPRYEDMFKDFTFFSDTMGAYTCTMHSVPMILSGDWYENDEDFQEYLDRAYTGEESIIRKLYDEGYLTDVYETDMRIDGSQYEFIDNVIPNKKAVNDPLAFIRWNIQMGGFRYFPYDIKRICFVSPIALPRLQVVADGEKAFYHDNKEFYEELLESAPEIISQKCFKYTRILGCHLPWIYDESFNEIKEGTYEDQMRSGLKALEKYLETMKSLGCYDNSIVIVLADHGYDPDGMNTLRRTNPILLIKGMNEHHDNMITDESRVSFTDLSSAYTDLLAGEKSTELFQNIADDRTRRFIFYEFLDEDQMTEYEQSGKATSWDTLIPTGNKYDIK